MSGPRRRVSRVVSFAALVVVAGACVSLPPLADGETYEPDASQVAIGDAGSEGGHDAGGTRTDSGVAVDAGVDGGFDAGHDAGVVVDAGFDAGPTRLDAGVPPTICSARSFDCGGVSPFPEQPRIPGTRCCCDWGLAPYTDGVCR